MTDKIQTVVGGQERTVDLDVFLDAHTRLADYYRALGLEGDKLDMAICEALPQRLAQILDGTAYQ